jgi:hypothetical protein
MSFNYKNPTSDTVVAAPFSVERTSDSGVNFSVNTVGGYTEVWEHSDLDWTIPIDTYNDGGQVNFSGNVIPISFICGGYASPPPVINQLNLFNDGISSGRRRLGMLVFVQQAQTTYQYTIPNYSSLWNLAVADGDINDLGTGYTRQQGIQCLPPQGQSYNKLNS